jgi:CARDB protein
LSFPEGRRPQRTGRAAAPHDADRQTLLLRRTIGLVAAIVLVIVLVIGIRGCLNSREDRAFRDYASDERALVRDSQAVAQRFFDALSKPAAGDALDVQTQVNGLRVDSQQLVERAQDTDPPDPLRRANGWLVETLRFRADAISRVADLLPTALGERGRTQAIASIAGQMQALLASDVIYLQRVVPELNRAYDKQGVEETFPTPRFLTDLGWLDSATVEERLSKVSGGQQKAATPGLHGTGLQSVTAQPSGIELTEQGGNSVPLSDELSFDIQVQNQGESEETDVAVTLTIQNGKRITQDQVIPRIAAGQTETVSIPITEQPDTEGVNTLTVEIAPVPGEGTKDNNTATYQVTFASG